MNCKLSTERPAENSWSALKAVGAVRPQARALKHVVAKHAGVVVIGRHRMQKLLGDVTSVSFRVGDVTLGHVHSAVVPRNFRQAATDDAVVAFRRIPLHSVTQETVRCIRRPGTPCTMDSSSLGARHRL